MARVALFSSTERLLESGLFAARWLMAPFYVGLLVSLVLLLGAFLRELADGAAAALGSPEQAILLVLSLVDLSLAGNLILIVTFSGYENFVSKLDTGANKDRPAWLGAIDFSGMKIKLISSIVAISAISLLKTYLEIAGVGAVGGHGAPDPTAIGWMLALHLTFVASGVLFALTDRIAESGHAGHRPAQGKPGPGGAEGDA